MKNFGLIGAAGFVAPRHMKAIKETGNYLVASFDPNDSVGIIDSYFPKAEFFTEFERFDRFVDKSCRSGSKIDYISICSPNYLHDSHVRFALRAGANVICEKPLVLNPWNLDALLEIEEHSDGFVSTILQLRYHPEIQKLKMNLNANNKKVDVDLTYITTRGNWYLRSWKGNEKKSGGIATNIGIHLFDMLHYIYGDLQINTVHLRDEKRAAGYLEFEKARVRWFLSVDEIDLPDYVKVSGLSTFRSLTSNGKTIEFSKGFTDLHNLSYEAIISGNGFGIEENRCAVEAVSKIRTADIVSTGEKHPFLNGVK